MLLSRGLYDSRGQHKLALAACKDDALQRWHEDEVADAEVEKFKKVEEGNCSMAKMLRIRGVALET